MNFFIFSHEFFWVGFMLVHIVREKRWRRKTASPIFQRGWEKDAAEHKKGTLYMLEYIPLEHKRECSKGRHFGVLINHYTRGNRESISSRRYRDVVTWKWPARDGNPDHYIYSLMYDRVRVSILDSVTPPKIARNTRPTMQFHYALFCNTIAMSLKRISRIYPRWIAQCGKIRKKLKSKLTRLTSKPFSQIQLFRPEFDSF